MCQLNMYTNLQTHIQYNAQVLSLLQLQLFEKKKSVVNFSFFEISIIMMGLSVAQYHITEFGSTYLSPKLCTEFTQ